MSGPYTPTSSTDQPPNPNYGGGSGSALSYELANSYPISRKVLLPDLQAALEDPPTFFLVKHMLSCPKVSSMDSGSGTAILTHFSDTKPCLASQTSHAVAAILSTVQAEDIADTTISSILSRVRAMGLALLDMQLMAGLSSGFRVDSLIAYVKGQLTNILKAMEAAAPFAKSSTDASPVALTEHLQMLRDVTMDYFNTKISADTRDWLFTDSLANIFFACMMPYMKLMYIASLVAGPWNAAGNLNNVTFYDTRYAELVIYRMVMVLYTELSTVTKVSTMQSAVDEAASSIKYRRSPITTAQLVSATAGLRDGYKNTLELKMQNAQDTLLDAHGGVALLSHLNKGASMDLNSKNQDFEFRRQTLKSLAMATAPMRAKLQAMQTAFRVWVAAYFVILVVAVLLIMTQRYNSFFILAILILLVLLLFIMVKVILAYVRNLSH